MLPLIRSCTRGTLLRLSCAFVKLVVSSAPLMAPPMVSCSVEACWPHAAQRFMQKSYALLHTRTLQETGVAHLPARWTEDMRMSPEARVLITGASGHIGQAICPFLVEHGFWLRGFDLHPCTHVHEHVQGDLQDLRTLRRAVQGVDTVIHLAACSDDADFVTRLVPANVIGLFNVFEAVRLEGVTRMILASSCQAADLAGRKECITTADCFPTDHYGLTKLWAEGMGQMYSHRYGISVLAGRLGWVIRSERELEEMLSLAGGQKLFLSHHDLMQFFLCCLKAEVMSFAVVYAFSRQKGKDIFDMEPSRRLIGFQPRDIFPEGIPFGSSPNELATRVIGGCKNMDMERRRQ